MTAFSLDQTYNRWDSREQVGIGLTTPFSGGRAIAENLREGLLSSFGLGTIVREASLPPRAVAERPVLGETEEQFSQRQADAERLSISQDDYQSSPYFREEIPWEQGLTEERAAAKAAAFDQRRTIEHFSQGRAIESFTGQFLGQAFDPVNYVPVFGPAARVYAVGRAGAIGGRVALSASEAAINTAAFGVLTAGIRGQHGDDVSFEAIISEIAMSALIGGAFGLGIGAFARRSDIRAIQAEKQAREALQTIENMQASRVSLNEAVVGLVNDGEVKLSNAGAEPVQRVSDEVALRTETTADAPARDGTIQVFDAKGQPARMERVQVESGVAVRDADGVTHIVDQSEFTSKDPFEPGFVIKSAQGGPKVANLTDEKLTALLDGMEGKIETARDNGNAARAAALNAERIALRAEQTRREIKKSDEAVSEPIESRPTKADAPVAGRPALRDLDSQADDQFSSDGLVRTPEQIAETREGLGKLAKTIDEQAAAQVEGAIPPKAIDLAAARPDPLPEGMAEAEARVGNGENMKQLADQHSVDLTTGDYVESFDIEQMREQGRLTKEDEAALKLVDEEYAASEAYGNTLKAALSCAT